ncbi:hypothetical protein MRX96_041227 [Rhipicephalus microplus]
MEPGTTAFFSYRGARFDDIPGLLERFPPTLPRLVLHVGTVDIVGNGCAQAVRNLKELESYSPPEQAAGPRITYCRPGALPPMCAGSPVPAANTVSANSSSPQNFVPPAPGPVTGSTSPTMAYSLRSYSEAA